MLYMNILKYGQVDIIVGEKYKLYTFKISFLKISCMSNVLFSVWKLGSAFDFSFVPRIHTDMMLLENMIHCFSFCEKHFHFLCSFLSSFPLFFMLLTDLLVNVNLFHFFLWLNNTLPSYIHEVFIPVSADVHMSNFHFLTIMNRAAMAIHAYVLIWVHSWTSLCHFHEWSPWMTLVPWHVSHNDIVAILVCSSVSFYVHTMMKSVSNGFLATYAHHWTLTILVSNYLNYTCRNKTGLMAMVHLTVWGTARCTS